jgi:hypothetical protein
MLAGALTEVNVVAADQPLPVLTEACNPPERGVKITAEVPTPLVETACPPPLATNTGELQVWAVAEPAQARAVTAKAAALKQLRKSYIKHSFENPEGSILLLGPYRETQSGMETTLVSLPIVLAIVNPLFVLAQTAGKGTVNSSAGFPNLAGLGVLFRALAE